MIGGRALPPFFGSSERLRVRTAVRGPRESKRCTCVWRFGKRASMANASRSCGRGWVGAHQAVPSQLWVSHAAPECAGTFEQRADVVGPMPEVSGDQAVLRAQPRQHKVEARGFATRISKLAQEP